MTMNEHGAVRLTGLRKRYGPVQAVDGVDLLIAPGEVVALLGPNGAGKSTTVDMLHRKPQPGPGDRPAAGGSGAGRRAGCDRGAGAGDP